MRPKRNAIPHPYRAAEPWKVGCSLSICAAIAPRVNKRAARTATPTKILLRVKWPVRRATMAQLGSSAGESKSPSFSRSLALCAGRSLPVPDKNAKSKPAPRRAKKANAARDANAVREKGCFGAYRLPCIAPSALSSPAAVVILSSFKPTVAPPRHRSTPDRSAEDHCSPALPGIRPGSAPVLLRATGLEWEQAGRRLRLLLERHTHSLRGRHIGRKP